MSADNRPCKHVYIHIYIYLCSPLAGAERAAVILPLLLFIQLVYIYMHMYIYTCISKIYVTLREAVHRMCMHAKMHAKTPVRTLLETLVETLVETFVDLL